MKVLLLNGSPKANGNTAYALSQMAEVFTAEGVEAEILHVGNQPIRGCIACGSCMRACPYQARHIDPARRVVDKCDYCASSRAEGMEPACVSVCTTRARVFGDVDDPQSPVSKVLGSHKVTFVEAEDAPTKPTLAYLNDVADKHWPKAESAGPVGFMGTVATGVRWLGALSLFGVVGVGLRQLIRPTGEASHEEKRKGS